MAVVDEGRATEQPEPDLGLPFIPQPLPPERAPRLEAGAAAASQFFGRWRAPLTALMALLLIATVGLAFASRSARARDDAREPGAQQSDSPTETTAASSATSRPPLNSSTGGNGNQAGSDRQPSGPGFDELGIGSASATSSPETTSAGAPGLPSANPDDEQSTTSSSATTAPGSSAPPEPPSTTSTAPSTTTTIPEESLPPPVDLVVNGGFEQAGPPPGSYGSFTPVGWTSSAGAVELWASGFDGVTSFSGRQHLELNGNGPETINQTVQVVPGQTYQWSLAHRGRENRDTVRVLVDNVVVDTIASDPGSWRVVSGTVTIPAGTTQVSFGLQAVDFGSKGNLIDAVTFRRVP